MHRRIRIIALLIVAAISLGLAGCTTPPANPASTTEPVATADTQTRLEKIKASGQLVMATESGFAPYEFIVAKDGKSSVEGMDIEIAREIAADLGVTLVIEDIPFDTIIAAVQTGAVDIAIAGITPRADRREAVDFSDLYFQASQTVMVRKGEEASYPDTASFAGKTLGAQKGSLQQYLLEDEIPDAEPRVIDAIAQMVLELRNKQIDGIVMEGPVADNWVRNYPNDLAIVPFTIPDPEGGNAIAIPKGNDDLVAAINETLKRLESEGKIQEFLFAAIELYEVQPK